MITKQHRICLDECDIQPKLITDVLVMEQYDNHGYETIEKIINRLNEPNNKKVIDEFLAVCNLDSILTDNERKKQSILKNFNITISRVFDDIKRELTQNQQENRRIIETLTSILPEYKSHSLSQIEGDFSFLKQEKMVELRNRSKDQMYLLTKSVSKITDLVFQIRQLLSKYQQEEEIVQPLEQPIQLIQEVKLIHWEEDSEQVRIHYLQFQFKFSQY